MRYELNGEFRMRGCGQTVIAVGILNRWGGCEVIARFLTYLSLVSRSIFVSLPFFALRGTANIPSHLRIWHQYVASTFWDIIDWRERKTPDSCVMPGRWALVWRGVLAKKFAVTNGLICAFASPVFCSSSFDIFPHTARRWVCRRLRDFAHPSPRVCVSFEVERPSWFSLFDIRSR